VGDTGSIALFIVLAFVLGGMVVWKKDEIPVGMRRGIALVVLTLVTMAFTLMVISFLLPGEQS
jgi:hypothetical protein